MFVNHVVNPFAISFVSPFVSPLRVFCWPDLRPKPDCSPRRRYKGRFLCGQTLSASVPGFYSAILLEGERLARDGQAYTYAENVNWYGQQHALRCWLESPPVLQSPANLSTARDALELAACVNGCAWARFCAEHKPEIYDEVMQNLFHRRGLVYGQFGLEEPRRFRVAPADFLRDLSCYLKLPMYWISASQNMPPSFLSGRILMHQTDRSHMENTGDFSQTYKI